MTANEVGRRPGDLSSRQGASVNTDEGGVRLDGMVAATYRGTLSGVAVWAKNVAEALRVADKPFTNHQADSLDTMVALIRDVLEEKTP